ncbi:MAG: histidine kinase [Eubacteriales bacterium]|nr:histidine kinase [Eubacteriales bacterium]
MYTLINKCILLVLSLTFLIRDREASVIISAMIAALILSSLSSYYEGRTGLLLSAAHCILSAVWLPMFPFLPLAAYDCYNQKNLYLRGLWLLPLLRCLTTETPAALISCTILCILACILVQKTSQYEQLLKEYHQVRDDSTEAAMLLQKQNKDLLKNQDYEVELATLAERNRIAREIHDNVGHLLTRSILQVSALLVVHRQDQELTEQLNSVKTTLTDAMDNVRSSVHDLHEDSVDLKQQLTGLLEAFTFCPVQLTFDSGILPREINYAVIAIVKEALSNIARHSNATEASVTVLEHPSLYQVVISDNGTKNTVSSSKGLGLSSMEERIRALDGIFHIDRRSGFKVFISIPKGGTLNENNSHR